jgi:exosortase
MTSALRPTLLALLPLGYLWFTLVNQLRPEWSSNPQYSYGWIVPVLCFGLLWRRWEEGRRSQKAGNPEAASAAVDSPPSRRLPTILFALFAVFFLPTRMLQAADPAWRLVDWLLAMDVIGLTLCGLYFVGGSGWVRRYAFPICFFLVAVPWLYPIEKWLIERLTFSVSAATVEVMGLLGVPAEAHGKVIELGTGVVGVDEACSGIRSFQSSLMISLFIGEFFRLGIIPRLILVPTGFVLSFAFNITRTSILTWIAARKGVNAIAEYHDQTGVTILLACSVSMWLLALAIKKREAKAGIHSEVVPDQAGQPSSSAGGRDFGPVTRLAAPLIALLGWLALVEAGVAFWSRSDSAGTANAVRWSIALPTENSSFRKVEPDKNALELLQYDEALQGEWREEDGSTWHTFYFNWRPGRVGAYLAANRHSPEICMTYGGWEMRSGPERVVLKIKNLNLPFRSYAFSQGGKTLHIFHCRWEPAFEANPALLESQSFGTTMRGFRGLSVLWSGKGKGGQKILEIVVQGYDNLEDAKVGLVEQLEKIIKIEPPVS